MPQATALQHQHIKNSLVLRTISCISLINFYHSSQTIMKMNQVLFYLSLLLVFSPFFSTISSAQSPAAAPKTPAKPAPEKPAPAPKASAKPAPAKPSHSPPAAAPSKPLVPALPEDSPDSSANDDIIKILRKAKSYHVLIRLLKTTQVISQINSQLITQKYGGLTIFAPDDGSFSELPAGFLNSLTNEQKIQFVQYHILPIYVSSSNFDSLSNPVGTVATDSPTSLKLNFTAYGSVVNITTGIVNATLTSIIYLDKQLAIYRVDKVLLPLEFFKPNTKPTASAPGLAQTKSPKADKDNASEDDDEDDKTQKKSDAISLLGSQGKMLMSIGVALVAGMVIWA